MEFYKEFEKFSFGFSSSQVTGAGTKHSDFRELTVDGDSAVFSDNASFKGVGCISANNSSRLLLDYKAKNPEAYREIMRLLFEKDYGAALSHIKLELGADVNSSSGTEPCTKRYEDEPADVYRGAGFVFASDALKINPDLSIDMLRWGEPAWVKNAFEISREKGFEARYKWYTDTMKAAFEKLDIRFTHVSPDSNETGDADEDWIIYFAKRLRSDSTMPYDCSAVKIVASDEVGTRTIAEKMVKNKELRDCVDIIGLHYTTFGDDNTKLLFKDFGKEIWYSEGIAPANVSELSVKADLSGISGKNSACDMACRIINAMFNGCMTMYELQPAVAAYYGGSCYYPKQIIRANEAWSGHFRLDSGFFTVMHFTRFLGDIRYPVMSACYGDGRENHFIEDSTHNYMTLMSRDKSQLTMHFANNSSFSRHYRISFINCGISGKKLNLCETSAPKVGESFDSGWFVNRGSITACDYEPLELTVKPNSVLTLTTMHTDFARGTANFRTLEGERARLALPYEDSFTYNFADEDFLAHRGGAPLYTTDQGGAFEIMSDGDKNFLVQKITESIIPDNWRFRGTPSPITSLGDDSWANYTAETEIIHEYDSDKCYAGIGVRYDSAVSCEATSNCGFAVKLFGNGDFELLYNDDVVERGQAGSFIKGKANTASVTAVGGLYTVYINGSLVGSYTETSPMQARGRVSLLSSYHKNSFAYVKVTPVPAVNTYADFADALCPEIRYFGNVKLNSCESYKFTDRTCGEIAENSGFYLGYKGCGFALCGKSENAVITVELDGKILSAEREASGSLYKQAFYRYDSCGLGFHTLKVTVHSGKIALDGVAVYTNSRDFVTLREPYIESKKDSSKAGKAAKAAACAAVGAAALLLLKKAVKKKNSGVFNFLRNLTGKC